MYKNRFFEIMSFCEKNGIKVALVNSEENLAYPKVNLISISTKQSWKKRLYTLLHEIGHIMIYRNKESWKKDFSVFTLDVYDQRKYRSHKYQVSLIAEEIDAWRIGRQIAEECNVFLDNEEYHSLMNSCVFSYIRDAINVIYL